MASADQTYSVNLEEVIEKWVWQQFKADRGFLRTLFARRCKHYIDIRWGYVDFAHVTKLVPRPTKHLKPKTEVQLYSSIYENRSDQTQTYSFNTERETTATTKIELQESYTIGAETNIEIDIAGLFKFGGGVNGSVSVTDTKGKELSDTVKWGIDTEIKVPKWHRAEASLRVDEEPLISDLEVKTTVTLPKKTLPVSVRRIADDKIVHSIWIDNLSDVFDDDYLERHKNNMSIIKIKDDDKNITYGIVLTTTGVCKNNSFKDQFVKVNTTKLDDAPPGTFDKKGDKSGDEKSDGEKSDDEKE